MKPSSTICARGHLQRVDAGRQALRELGAAAAQQAGELILGQRVGHRRHGAERRGRIGAEHDRDRIRLARIPQCEFAEISAPPRWASQRMISLLRPISCWR
jgi:hypothetical protein